jgi:hypothetical protein
MRMTAATSASRGTDSWNSKLVASTTTQTGG